MRLAGLGSCKKRAVAISKMSKMAANADVKAAKSLVISKSTRNFKDKDKTKRKMEEKKEEREAKRSNDLEEFQQLKRDFVIDDNTKF